MVSPYDPEGVAKAMAGGVVSTLAALREENARLTRERDEAREKLASLETDYAEAQDIAVSESAGRRAAEAEVARSHDAILHLTREVSRLEGLILDWQTGLDYSSGQPWVAIDAAARRIRAQRGLDG